MNEHRGISIELWGGDWLQGMLGIGEMGWEGVEKTPSVRGDAATSPRGAGEGQDKDRTPSVTLRVPPPPETRGRRKRGTICVSIGL